MYRLKIAPISYASIMFIPTARPARIVLTHRWGDLSSKSRPRAMKLSPNAMVWEATPQQAVERKWELRAAARPPSRQASGESFICRKQNHAPSPRMKSEAAGKIFAKRRGDVTNRKVEVILIAGVGL